MEGKMFPVLLSTTMCLCVALNILLMCVINSGIDVKHFYYLKRNLCKEIPRIINGLFFFF